MSEDFRQSADAPRYSSLRDYLRVLRERWALILACTLVLGGAAFALTATKAKIYEAESTLNPRQRGADTDLIGGNAASPVSPQSLTAELAAMAERDQIANRVSRSLDEELSPAEVSRKISASIDAQTNLVNLTATDRDPARAAEIANAYSEEVQAEALRNERDQIGDAIGLVRRQLDDAKSSSAVVPDEIVILTERLNRLQTLKEITRPVEIVSAAEAPGAPIAPKPARNTTLGLLAGLFLGIILAFARDSLDTRLKTPREIEDQLGLTRVGQLTDGALGRSLREGDGIRQLEPVDLEAARIMRTNLEFLASGRALRTVAVTSPLPGEGKSTAAMALAWAAAVGGKQTLLVECDLRRSVIAERLGLRPAPGLTDAIRGTAQPPEVLQPIDLGVASSPNGAAPAAPANRLICITAGTPVPDPADILASAGFADFLSAVADAYDLVVLDTSPLLSVVDTRELLPSVDGVVICARSHQTTRDQARATREALDNASIELAGLVVTGVKVRDDDYTGYYRRYIQSTPMASRGA